MVVFFEKLKFTALFLIPFWFWLGMYLFIAPDSALVRLLVVGLGVWFLGIIQLICLCVLVFLIFPDIDHRQRRFERSQVKVIDG